MQKVCIASVATQTSKDFEHLLIKEDQGEKGYGIVKANAALAHVWPIHAEYVMVLDDDNMLVDMDFVRVFRDMVKREGRPEIVFFRGYIKSLGFFPPENAWGKAPGLGYIDYFCFALRWDFWEKHIRLIPDEVNHDFMLIDECYRDARHVYWLDRFVARSQDLPAKTRPTEDIP